MEVKTRARVQAYRETINFLLAPLQKGWELASLQDDLSDGLLLIELAQFYEGRSVGRYHSKPFDDVQKAENIATVLSFWEECGMVTRDIQPTSILRPGRDLTGVFDLLWRIIIRYHVERQHKHDPEEKTALATERISEALIDWCNKKLRKNKHTKAVQIRNLSDSFKNGVALACLLQAVSPGSIDHTSLNPKNSVKNLTLVLDLCDQHLAMPPVVAPQFMASGQVPPEAVITCLSFIRNFSVAVFARSTNEYKGGDRKSCELTFGPHEVVEVWDDEGSWLRGKVNGRNVGWFPSSHVKYMKDGQMTYLDTNGRGGTGGGGGGGTGTAFTATGSEEEEVLRDHIAELERQLASVKAAGVMAPRPGSTVSGDDNATEAAAAAIADLRRELQRAGTLVERERARRAILQKNLDEERRRKHLDRLEIVSMRQAFLEWEEKETARKQDEEKKQAVMEDLVHNSEMLPDMMLAHTRLEMELDELELENANLRERLEGANRSQRSAAAEHKRQLEEQEDRALEAAIAKSGDQLAADLHRRLKAQRRQHDEDRQKMQADHEALEQKLAAEQKKHKDDIVAMKALVKKERGRQAKTQERLDQAAADKAKLRNEVIILQAGNGVEPSTAQSAARLDSLLQDADDEKDEVIRMHMNERGLLEDKNSALEAENDDLMRQLEQQREELKAAIKEFDTHKSVVRNRDAAGAKYKLQLLKRIRAVEAERDALRAQVTDLQDQLAQLLGERASAEAMLARERKASSAALQEEKQRRNSQLERAKRETQAAIDAEIKRAEDEVAKLKKRTEEERKRRQTASKMEAARRRARSQEEEENKRRLEREREEATMEELVQQYKQENKQAAIQIYSTEEPNIYIFGTRKIQLMVLNGELYVRVGGGYVTIDEFVLKNAPSEARKLRISMDQAAQQLAKRKMEERKRMMARRRAGLAAPTTPRSGRTRSKRSRSRAKSRGSRGSER